MFPFIFMSLAAETNFYFLCYTAPIWLIRWTCFLQRGKNTEHGRTIKKGNKIFQHWCFSRHVYLQKKIYIYNLCFLVKDTPLEHTLILLNGWNPVGIHTLNWEVMDIPQKRDKKNKWTQEGAVSAEGERQEPHISLWCWPNFIPISMKYTLLVQLL